VEERGELAGHGDHRAFLRILPASRGEAEPPAPQVGVGAKGTEAVSALAFLVLLWCLAERG
jgi:hypothetical protein